MFFSPRAPIILTFFNVPIVHFDFHPYYYTNSITVKNYKALFFKYISNTCNKDELNEFIDWGKSPENADQLKKLIAKDWDRLSKEKLEEEASGKNFEELLHKIQEEEKKVEMEEKVHHSNRIKFGKIVLRIAANIAIPLAVGLWAYKFGSGDQKNLVPSMNTISAPIGSKTKVALSDGSIIWLNSGSTLEYPSLFSEKNRTVKLTGEGYFEVSKNKKWPFIVKTSDIDIKVLGTKFNLKSYPNEGTIETMLIEGKVVISKPGEGKDNNNYVELKPKEKATFIKKKGRIIQGTIKGLPEPVVNHIPKQEPERKEQLLLSEIEDVEPYTAWKDEKLVFKNENFEEVCILMERWYNVKINLHAEELKNYHYTGTLKNENIIDAIKAFQITLSFQYEINHNVIDIWPNT